MKLLNLLQEKNHFLKKFIQLNDREMIHFSSGIFDEIELFYENREKILDIIKYLDDEIDTEQIQLKDSEVSKGSADVVQVLLQQKNELVAQIIRQDLEVLGLIEAAKSQIIKDLQEVKKNKKAISGYRLPNKVYTFDEEA